MDDSLTPQRPAKEGGAPWTPALAMGPMATATPAAAAVGQTAVALAATTRATLAWKWEHRGATMGQTRLTPAARRLKICRPVPKLVEQGDHADEESALASAANALQRRLLLSVVTRMLATRGFCGRAIPAKTRRAQLLR